MATRTRPSNVTPIENARTAAAYTLVPKPDASSNVGGFDNRRVIDIMLNGRTREADELSWYFYERIPELRYIARYIANSISLATIFIGQVDKDPLRPTPVKDSHPAQDLLNKLIYDFGGMTELLDRLALHLTVPGDSVLMGPTGAPALHPFDRWRVYSTSEVIARNGRILYKEPMSREVPIPAGVLPVRIWRSHPKWWWDADSATRSSFSVLREIDLLDQHVHATAVSRISGAGILGIPDELTLPGDEDSIDGPSADNFVKYLTKVMSTAIKNRDSAAALVPIVIRGPGELIKMIQHWDFSTKFDERVPELRTLALKRLALGMDVPPEILMGMGNTNHWSSWQTDESTVRLHIQPIMQLICNSLTDGYLRPMLETISLPNSVDPKKLVIWFDTSKLRVQSSVSADSQQNYDRFEINGETLRNRTGFGQEDAPSDKELAKMILLKLLSNSNPAMAPYAIDALRDIGIPLPDAKPIKLDVPQGNVLDDQGNIIEEAQSKAANPIPTNPNYQPPAGSPKPAQTSQTPSLPGKRSQAAQTSPPPVPPANGDGSRNQH